MMEEQNNRTKWLNIKLIPDEYQKIIKDFNKSTCRKISVYASKKHLQKPIVNTYWKQFVDDFMAEIIRLRAELNAIGKNLNQAVKKLQTLYQITDFKHRLISMN